MVSVEQIKAKYNTIEKNIDAIVGKLEASRQIAIRDNNLLQKQFENNCDYVDQLEDLIVAGKIKSSELAERITLICSDEKLKDRLGENAKEISENYRFDDYVTFLKIASRVGKFKIDEVRALKNEISTLKRKNKRLSIMRLKAEESVNKWIVAFFLKD